MGKVRGERVTFDPERIVMSGGATGANEMIMFCLADPGDAFLVPTPYYPAYVPFIYLLFSSIISSNGRILILEKKQFSSSFVEDFNNCEIT